MRLGGDCYHSAGLHSYVCGYDSLSKKEYEDNACINIIITILILTISTTATVIIITIINIISSSIILPDENDA